MWCRSEVNHFTRMMKKNNKAYVLTRYLHLQGCVEVSSRLMEIMKNKKYATGYPCHFHFARSVRRQESELLMRQRKVSPAQQCGVYTPCVWLYSPFAVRGSRNCYHGALDGKTTYKVRGYMSSPILRSEEVIHRHGRQWRKMSGRAARLHAQFPLQKGSSNPLSDLEEAKADFLQRFPPPHPELQ